MPNTYNVAAAARRHAAERPDQAALKYPSSAYTTARPAWDTQTYAEFDERSDAYARGLAAEGIRAGDRVLMLMKPQMDLWTVLFALFKIGAAPVIVDPNMGRPALLAAIERSACRVVIATPVIHALRTTVFRKPFAAAEVFITVGIKLWWGGARLSSCLVEGEGPYPMAMLDGDAVAAIAFTSGSTGVPKGVVYHQSMWDAAVKANGEIMSMKPGDVSVQAFAAFAIYDLSWGHTTVIPKADLSKPATADPADFAAAITANGAQMAFASPIIWRKLLPYCEERSLKLPSLDKAITTGAPTPPDMVRGYAGVLREGVEFHTPYGATEAIPVAHIGSNELLAHCIDRTIAGHGTAVGTPAPGIDLRIIAVTDEAIPTWDGVTELGVGEVGEIIVSGAQVSQRYADAERANTEAKVHDGDRIWHRMGDLGRLDDTGRLWFCGRKGHRLETAHGMVPSVPAEGVFNEHPDVFRTALVGIGEPGSQIPVLAVELHPGRKWEGRHETELERLAADTPWAGVVKRFVPYGAFPTDARHNSKIRRGDIRTTLAPQCRDLVEGARS